MSFHSYFQVNPGRLVGLLDCDNLPWLQKSQPYPIPLTKLGVVEQDVEKMQEMGVIVLLVSPTVDNYCVTIIY